MSTHRDLKQAQLALNEAVGAWRHTCFAPGYVTVSEQHSMLMEVVAAFDAWDALRKQFDGDRPAVARDTSIAAAKTNPSSAGSLRRRVVEAILARWKLYQAGMTTDQLEVQFKRSHQSVSSAVSDMESKGWIKDSGERRETRSRCKAIVYVPTDLALTWAAEAHLEAG